MSSATAVTASNNTETVPVPGPDEKEIPMRKWQHVAAVAALTAATAIVGGRLLVTRDQIFGRIPGVPIENWSA
jgi:predicted metalloenzyme YecM